MITEGYKQIITTMNFDVILKSNKIQLLQNDRWQVF